MACDQLSLPSAHRINVDRLSIPAEGLLDDLLQAHRELQSTAAAAKREEHTAVPSKVVHIIQARSIYLIKILYLAERLQGKLRRDYPNRQG